jgi:hypothetical protein
MTGKRTPADVLREARKNDSLAKRSRVLAVLDEMKAKDEPVTFLGVARAARVSNWLVYAEGVREHIEAARKGQAGRTAREQRAGTTAGPASLATDLEITRAELRRTRDERDRLKAKVQRGLGHQVTRPAPPSSPPGSRTSPAGSASKTPNSPRPAARSRSSPQNGTQPSTRPPGSGRPYGR